jgi:MFS family permease
MRSGVAVVIALAAACSLAAVGILRGTYAAGGSDSSCYALMAATFASGRLLPSSALVREVPWPDATKSFAPGGFIPSRFDSTAAAPVCAPGFSMLLAPLLSIGGDRMMFALTPLCGALLVWLAFVAARDLGGPVAGAVASVLVAASPAILYQVVQPMNDVTTAALWMGVFVSLAVERWTLAGICGGLALLVRPNLAPLAAIAALYIAWQAPAESRRRFFLAALPFVAILLTLNAAIYGGALRTGYGAAGNLFSLSVFPGNASRYAGWLMSTQTPFILLGLAAPFLVDARKRPPVFLALAFVGVTCALYFAYTPFDDWSYLRFLMPAIALLIVLSSVVLTELAARLGPRAGAALATAVTIVVALVCVRQAHDRLAFTLHALEQRYRSAGIVARDRLPAQAAVLTTWDSGAIRFHARKEAIVWDAIDPAWLDRSIHWLSEHDRPPYLLLESWEEPRFRARFGEQSALGRLDWPPKYEVDRVVRIYDPEDRARYWRGEHVATEYLWPLRNEKRKTKNE